MLLQPYVCTLDEASIKTAQEELNEIPSDREAAIKNLRDWIKAQSHLKVPEMTDGELLMFLRGSKFSQLRAREMIEGNMTMRSMSPEWFNGIDPLDPKIQLIFDDGYVLPLPKRTKEGCQVLLYRLGALDANLKRYSRADTVRAAMTVGAYISKSELTQVHGSIFIFDFTGYTAKHMASQMNSSDMKKFQKLWQKNVPGRFKKFHYYNAGLFFEALMAIARPFMEKKYIERIKLHDNLESLYKHIPMELLPEEYLPDDYTGPNSGSCKDILENFKNEVKKPEFRDRLLYTTGSLWGIDESKRPAPSKDMPQSFRKLNVD